MRTRFKTIDVDGTCVFYREAGEPGRPAILLLRGSLAPATSLFQYTHRVADPDLVSPDGRTLDGAYLARPGNFEIQLDLLLDDASNVAAYANFQGYFRAHQSPLHIIPRADASRGINWQGELQ